MDDLTDVRFVANYSLLRVRVRFLYSEKLPICSHGKTRPWNYREDCFHRTRLFWAIRNIIDLHFIDTSQDFSIDFSVTRMKEIAFSLFQIHFEPIEINGNIDNIAFLTFLRATFYSLLLILISPIQKWKKSGKFWFVINVIGMKWLHLERDYHQHVFNRKFWS